jgi:hypothetical protein
LPTGVFDSDFIAAEMVPASGSDESSLLHEYRDKSSLFSKHRSLAVNKRPRMPTSAVRSDTGLVNAGSPSAARRPGAVAFRISSAQERLVAFTASRTLLPKKIKNAACCVLLHGSTSCCWEAGAPKRPPIFPESAVLTKVAISDRIHEA